MKGALQAELMNLGEDLVGIGKLPFTIALDKADLPLRVYDEGRAHVRVPLRPVDAVVLADGAMDVGEQRIVADADRLGPVVVAEWAISADTQHLGIDCLKVADALVEGRHARASTRRPVERIEQDDDVLTAEFGEPDLLEPDRPQGEVRRDVADVQDFGLIQSVNPPFANLRGARSFILARDPRVAATRAGGLRTAAHARFRRLSSGVTSTPR